MQTETETSLAGQVYLKANEVLSFDGMDSSHPEEFMYEYFPAGGEVLVAVEDYGNTRWESHEGYVFKLSDGSYIMFGYACGLTEMQDHRGIESVDIVEPYEVTTVKYRSVK